MTPRILHFTPAQRRAEHNSQKRPHILWTKCDWNWNKDAQECGLGRWSVDTDAGSCPSSANHVMRCAGQVTWTLCIGLLLFVQLKALLPTSAQPICQLAAACLTSFVNIFQSAWQQKQVTSVCSSTWELRDIDFLIPTWIPPAPLPKE